MEEKKATAWRFVWTWGGFFSSPSKERIESYAQGAWGSFGSDCGRIEAMYEDDPVITEGRA